MVPKLNITGLLGRNSRKRQIVDQLIDQTLQGAYIRARGYRISDQELNRQIQAIPDHYRMNYNKLYISSMHPPKMKLLI